jgi:ABC-2 type transport system permease protein
MRKAWIIAWRDLRMTLHSGRSWLLLLVVPALTIYVAGLGARGLARSQAAAIRIDVLGRDGSAASGAFLAALAQANEAFVLCPAHAASAVPPPVPGPLTFSMAGDAPGDPCLLAGEPLSVELAEERLVSEVTSALLMLEGFDAAFERDGEATVIFRPGQGLANPEIAFNAVRDVASRMSGPLLAARVSTRMAASHGIEADADFYAARLAEAQASWGPLVAKRPPPPIQVNVRVSGPNEKRIVQARSLENGFMLSVPSIAVTFVMISALGLTQSLAEERVSGLLRRVGMMPVKRAQLLSGKLLATCVLGLLQFAVLIAFGELLGVSFGRAPLALMVIASAYVLAVTALALALAALARTPRQASALATSAWIVLVLLGGGWWPLILVPPWLRALGHLSPVAWCLDGLNALVFYQGTLADVVQPAAVLLLFAIALFIVSLCSRQTGRPSARNPPAPRPTDREMKTYRHTTKERR